MDIETLMEFDRWREQRVIEQLDSTVADYIEWQRTEGARAAMTEAAERLSALANGLDGQQAPDIEWLTGRLRTIAATLDHTKELAL